MEPQQKTAANQISTTAPSPISPHSLMQAYFTAAALSGSKMPPTTVPSPQQLYPPGSGHGAPFFTGGFAAMPSPFPPFFPYPATSVTPIAPTPAQATQPAAKES